MDGAAGDGIDRGGQVVEQPGSRGAGEQDDGVVEVSFQALAAAGVLEVDAAVAPPADLVVGCGGREQTSQLSDAR